METSRRKLIVSTDQLSRAACKPCNGFVLHGMASKKGTKGKDSAKKRGI